MQLYNTVQYTVYYLTLLGSILAVADLPIVDLAK